jgi:hypothetical protein
VLVLTFLSHPVLMVLDGGNLDGPLFALMALFVLANRKGYIKTSAVRLAVASALKSFPAPFGLLFVADRRSRAALLSGTLFVLLSAAGSTRS